MNSLGPFGKAAEGVIDFILKYGVQHVTYIVYYKKNVVELNDCIKNLGFEKERIDQQCDDAEKNLNNIEGKVKDWVQKVSELKIIEEDFVNDEGHKKARSPNCYVFPYLWNRHRLSRQAKKMEIDVKRLIDESSKFDEVAYRQNVTSNDTMLVNFGFVEFGSTKSTMDKVMTQLEDSTVRMIGLFGPGGVGKSTLIKEIARKAKDKKLFNMVVKVEIKAKPNPQRIQEEIAYVLGLRFEGEGENVRADCLRRRLKKEKGNILLILDDLWEKLDLNKLGIPLDDFDDDLRSDNKNFNHLVLQKDDDEKGHNRKEKKEKTIDSQKGCKILLTSRHKNVLCDEMDEKSILCVKELDDNDALMLFQKLAGIQNEMSDSKQEIVKKYCAGLPMAIVSVARALRNKSESVWGATLEKLKKQELVGAQTSMDISVKISYDHLENEEIKSIFLLCAQMGHQPLIVDLVKYCFGLGILEGVSSLWEARDRIKTSLQKLKDSGLLSDGISNNHFNMHDMVRDAALSIANKDRNVFTLRNGKLDDWPELEKCTSISICCCDIIDGLPETINCSQLKFFQIDTNDPSLKIPENIFEGMKNLRVLILAGFRLSRLPTSIKCLLKLRMFCLERCTLDENLGIIGELKKLRILSFSGSQLNNFPAELGCLDKLQLLDISDCSLVENKILPNLLSRLTNLEELYIRKSLIKMFVEEKTNQGQNSFLSELRNLHQLKVVDLSIPCVSLLPNHLFFDKLKDYKIVIGDFELFSVGDFRMPEKYEAFRVLALQLNDDTNIHSQPGLKLLFKRVESLLLGKADGVQNVVNALNIDGFPHLKQLSIINNNDIKYVNSTKLSNCVHVFPNLESLFLYNLGSMEMISYGPVTIASFAKLRAITIKMCYQLKNLYSFYTIKFLTSGETCEISECNNSYMDKFRASIETIEISECESIKEILQIPVDYGKVEFLKLHTLTLQSLPSFTSFYTKVERSCEPHMRGTQTTDRGHGEITNEEDDQSNKAPPLFDELVEIPNLESLNLSSLNIHKIWNDQLSSSFYFQNLIKLVMKDCDKLTYLCSLSMASSLKNLKSLVISECPIMEKIFETHGNNADKVCIFPNLEEIHLRKMNRLANMWQSKVSVDSFSSLISVNIEKCNKLEKIFPSHMEGWVESLENLKVSRCQSVEVIFELNDCQEIDAVGGIDTNLQVILLKDLPKLKQLWSTDPDGILNFKKLRTIDVDRCDELRNLFPVSVAKDLSNLEHMSALCCQKMVEIVANQDASEAHKDPLVFPKLTYVRLYLLPNIRHLYKGRHPIKIPKLKELSVAECVKLKTFFKETDKGTNEQANFVFSAEEIFPNLEYMEIDSNQAQNLLPEYEMHRLKELSLISVQGVDLLYQFPYKMPNLENLNLIFSICHEESLPRAYVSRQKKMGIVLQLKQLCLISSKMKELGFDRDQVLQRLELLRLEDCNKLSILVPPSVSFPYLTYLELKDCWGLENLMASSTAKSMVQLKTMKVINCPCVEQIVSNEGSEEDAVVKIVFNKLTSVELVRLKNMTSFCNYDNCEFEFPSLEILIVRECPEMEKFTKRSSIAPKLRNIFRVEEDEKAKWLWEGDMNATLQKVFNDKVSLAYTEDLQLDQFIIEQLWQASPSVQQNSFGYLKRLTVSYCESVEHVIPSHLLSCFHNLEELKVDNCEAAQVIFNIDEKSVRKASGIFRLKKLYLDDLPELKHVWDKDPEGIIGLQLLKKMHVENCKRLKNLFPASVAKDLTRLQVLEVTNCEELVEIVWKDEKGAKGERTTQEFVFRDLTTLTLEELPALKYSLHSKQQESISNLSEGDTQELRFGSQVIPNSCFDLLESLSVNGCQFLSDVLLPFNLLPFLTNLKKLHVVKCDNIKTIFDITCATQDRESTSVGPTLPFTLKHLLLSNLPNLENVWNEDPHGSLNMHCLEDVFVCDCKCLKSVFPASVAKDLMKLETLNVLACKKLMTIVAEDNTYQSLEVTFPCPCVRSLTIQDLPNFKYFYYCSPKSDIYTHLESDTEDQLGTEEPTSNLQCLSLGKNGVEMIISGEFQRNFLHNMKVLTLYVGRESDVFPYEILKQVPNIEKLVVCDGSLKEIFCSQNPNYNVDYSGILLQLKELRLESLEELVSIGLENSWTDPFLRNLETLEVIGCSRLKNLVRSRVSFSSLTNLKVESCDQLPYLFTSSTAKSLGQLKTMEIKYCLSIKVIVSKEGGESDEDEIIFPQLSYLKVESCMSMLSLFTSSTTKSLGQLKTIEIKSCDYIKEIVSKKVEESDEDGIIFPQLSYLKVESCNHLSYLFTSSAAKSFDQLKTMEIKRCHSIEEIVSRKESDDDEIIFTQLNCLNLEDLENLRRFCEGSLSFPSLEELSITNCDKMVTLCPGTLKADKLSQVVVGTSEVIQLETDLNSTMRETFLEKISELDEVDLKDRPGVQEIWCGSLHLHIPDLCFSKLATLIVDDCHFLSDAVLPFPLLPLLPQLETLEVRNCDFVKTIFDVKSTTKDRLVTLPLEKLTLSNLSNLENVWNEDPRGILSMHSLQQVFVDTCKCLKSVFPASVVKDLVKLEDLVVEDCEGLMAIVADESDENQEIVFERLQVLDLKRLEELRYFYDGNFTLSFPSLKEVHVIECSSMKTFSAFNKIDDSIKWYYSEYGRPRKERDLNYALYRTSEEQVPDASTAIISDSDTDGEHGDD